MRIAWVLVAGMVLGGLAWQGDARACKSMGENVHVGVITQVNAADGRLTITDAETRGPIEFTATAETLAPLRIGDQVTVSFIDKAGRLVAETVEL